MCDSMAIWDGVVSLRSTIYKKNIEEAAKNYIFVVWVWQCRCL